MDANPPKHPPTAIGATLYVSLMDVWIPRLFTWIEWASLIALIQFVGKKFDAPIVHAVGLILTPVLGLHIGACVGVAAGYSVRDNGRMMVAVTLLAPAIVSTSLWGFMDVLIAALVKSQG